MGVYDTPIPEGLVKEQGCCVDCLAITLRQRYDAVSVNFQQINGILPANNHKWSSCLVKSIVLPKPCQGF
jgi:hypothetical protein